MKRPNPKSKARSEHLAVALRTLAELVERDPSVSGMTLLIPGEPDPIYIDAETVRPSEQAQGRRQ